MNVRLCALVLFALLAQRSVCLGISAEDARKIVDANKEAVVSVQLVVEMQFPWENEKEETKSSTTGTIIDPSGLVVAALSQVDPAREFADLPFGDGGRKPQSKITDAKIRTEDGTEIPVDIVLRDQDLDLIFFKPQKPLEKPLPFVDLTSQSAPQVLDEVVLLWRLGQVANKSLAADIARVQSILTRPRLAYVVTVQTPGCPVFATDGKPVGVSVLRKSPTQAKEDTFSWEDNWLTTVLPCSTVLKAAQHAKEAKPEKPAEQPESSQPKTQPSTKPPAKSK